MPEQEVKLHVPRAASQAVARELDRDGATRIGLQAMYFDTPQRELAGARIALRLRREGDQWVQTLKMPGADAISRVELNHQRPGPILDLSVYAGTDQEAPLAALRGELGVCYQTDVSRLLRNVRTREGTVEVAHDTGWLRGGGLALPIDEIEFELVSGRPAAIFRLAHRWQQRHRLILDPRSKSERGDALAQTAVALAQATAAAGNVVNAGTGVGGAGLGSPAINGAPNAAKAVDAARAREIARFWAPRGAASIKLTDDMDPSQALACMTAECLQQIARNAAVLSEVDTEGVYDAGKAEHVHQLRVGVRRLRSAWRLMQGWTALPPEAARNALRDYFTEFGANRDQDVQEETVLPMLRAAGMPDVELPRHAHGNDARSLASSPRFQGWLLDMLQWCVTPEAARTAPPAARAASAATTGPAHSPTVPTIIPLTNDPGQMPLRTRLARRLRRWHRKVVQDGLRFAELTTHEKHAVRKRAKRLRYGLAFAESLMPTHRIRSYRRRLAQVQDILGEFNDLAVARDRYAQRTEQFPQAWFASGWIAARQEALTHQAAAAFERLAKTPPFWK